MLKQKKSSFVLSLGQPIRPVLLGSNPQNSHIGTATRLTGPIHGSGSIIQISYPPKIRYLLCPGFILGLGPPPPPAPAWLGLCWTPLSAAFRSKLPSYNVKYVCMTALCHKVRVSWIIYVLCVTWKMHMKNKCFLIQSFSFQKGHLTVSTFQLIESTCWEVSKTTYRISVAQMLYLLWERTVYK